MSQIDLEYAVDKATTEDLLSFFKESDELFDPPLHTMVDFDTYVVKIRTLARTMEVWLNGKLVGYVAVYINDVNKKDAFVLNMSVIPEYRSYKVFQKLREMVVEAARQADFERVVFEVQKKNKLLVELYRRSGFEIIGDKDEEHLIMALYFK